MNATLTEDQIIKNFQRRHLMFFLLMIVTAMSFMFCALDLSHAYCEDPPFGGCDWLSLYGLSWIMCLGMYLAIGLVYRCPKCGVVPETFSYIGIPGIAYDWHPQVCRGCGSRLKNTKS